MHQFLHIISFFCRNSIINLFRHQNYMLVSVNSFWQKIDEWERIHIVLQEMRVWKKKQSENIPQHKAFSRVLSWHIAGDNTVFLGSWPQRIINSFRSTYWGFESDKSSTNNKSQRFRIVLQMDETMQNQKRWIRHNQPFPHVLSRYLAADCQVYRLVFPAVTRLYSSLHYIQYYEVDT